jgi:hypothetical protein
MGNPIMPSSFTAWSAKLEHEGYIGHLPPFMGEMYRWYRYIIQEKGDALRDSPGGIT